MDRAGHGAGAEAQEALRCPQRLAEVLRAVAVEDVVGATAKAAAVPPVRRRDPGVHGGQ